MSGFSIEERLMSLARIAREAADAELHGEIEADLAYVRTLARKMPSYDRRATKALLAERLRGLPVEKVRAVLGELKRDG